MSHRALWEQLLNDPRQNYMVVAEDDAVPLVSSQRFIRKLPQDVDFVHFGCGSRCNRRPFIGAHCYLVTRAGARKYFAHWKNRIDVAVDKAIGVRLLRVKPELATVERLVKGRLYCLTTTEVLKHTEHLTTPIHGLYRVRSKRRVHYG
jgi:GR25 family glycosyltransferase involved in LPS biosynthesis